MNSNVRVYYRRQDCSDCNGKLCMCLGYANTIPWLVICFVLLVVIIPVGLYLGLNPDAELFTPMETRTLDRDNTFCGGLILNVTSKTTPATLYRLSQPPRLEIDPDDSGLREFVEAGVDLGPNDYTRWWFHLHPGSTVNISVCTTQGSNLFLYVFRGKNFERWVNNSLLSVSSFSSSIQAVGNCLYEFTDSIVTEEDRHYVLHSVSSRVRYSVNVSLLRTDYAVENVVESCTAGGSGHSQECTVSNDREDYYVLKTGNGPLLDYRLGVYVHVYCQLAGGPVAGLVLGLAVAYLIFCAVVIGSIWWCAWCIDRGKARVNALGPSGGNAMATFPAQPRSDFPTEKPPPYDYH